MTDHEASRTLVKSPPELWAECSDAGSLARHLGAFGEIKITRRQPETSVEWEGEQATGTVRIEPSAWGTRVTLTAQVAGAQPSDPAPPDALPESVRHAPAAPAARESRGLLMRLRARFASAQAVSGRPPGPVAAPPQEPSAPKPRAGDSDPSPVDALSAALDSLGAAHHRPFSRG